MEGLVDKCELKEGFHYQMHDEARHNASHNSKGKGADDGQELAERLKSHMEEDHKEARWNTWPAAVPPLSNSGNISTRLTASDGTHEGREKEYLDFCL